MEKPFIEPGCERFLQLNSGKNLHNTLGLEITYVSKTLVKAKLLVKEDLRQPIGLLHGGVSVAISEGLGSIGANMAAGEGYYALGLEINANHIHGVEANGTKYILCESSCVHNGKSTQIWETRIKREDNGKLICISRFTCFVLPKSKL